MPAEQARPKTGRKILWTVIIFVSIIILLSICCLMVIGIGSLSEGVMFGQGYQKEVMQEGSSDEKIYVINLRGVILDAEDGIHETSIVEYVINGLEEAKDDENVKAVIIRLDTPGGSVYDSARITDKMAELSQEGKPVVTVIESMAASGGYWVAAPSDHIFAHRESITGSIGVLWQFVEYDELLNKIGIRDVVITNTEGRNKAPKDISNPESEANKIFKDLADESFNEFISLIENGRNLKRDEIMPYADGRILSARQAKEAKLIDQLGDTQDAIDYIIDQEGLEDPQVNELVRTEIAGWGGVSAKANVIFGKTNDPIYSRGIMVLAMPEFMFEEQVEN